MDGDKGSLSLGGIVFFFALKLIFDWFVLPPRISLGGRERSEPRKELPQAEKSLEDVARENQRKKKRRALAYFALVVGIAVVGGLRYFGKV
ncbi:MAG: hypothetical protein LBL72_00405 [Candidatus Accumulibacter sp.]|jgi:predicted nucleic acid-binding Zn ribbon protein|nr:hypothetical protein [Accumulibacter sp.]